MPLSLLFPEKWKNHQSLPPSLRVRKRKADEIADSEDEDGSDGEYGWIEGDDAELLENPTDKS